MSKVKLIELDSYTDPKTKVVSRRFVDQLAYLRQKDYWGYNKPIIGASHIFRDNEWFIWTGNDYIPTEEPLIVTDLKELNSQEL